MGEEVRRMVWEHPRWNVRGVDNEQVEAAER